MTDVKKLTDHEREVLAAHAEFSAACADMDTACEAKALAEMRTSAAMNRLRALARGWKATATPEVKP